MTNTNKDNCFYSDSFKDYRGKPIKLCWSEELWITHLNKHPEIIDPLHTSELISKTVLEPSLVMTGYRPGNAKEMLVCYYKEHKRSESDVYYSKVVIGCSGPDLYVKTVFMGWALYIYVVQEKKYNFKELYRDKKTFL
ncbi:MAG: hypothetical protein NUV47_03545 [Patescibacteria group bacterium]|nr:hypothetical protein [Patescibacteria group bacterium]